MYTHGTAVQLHCLLTRGEATQKRSSEEGNKRRRQPFLVIRRQEWRAGRARDRTLQAKSNREWASIRLFWMGVPVRMTRQSTGMVRSAL